MISETARSSPDTRSGPMGDSSLHQRRSRIGSPRLTGVERSARPADAVGDPLECASRAGGSQGLNRRARRGEVPMNLRALLPSALFALGSLAAPVAAAQQTPAPAATPAPNIDLRMLPLKPSAGGPPTGARDPHAPPPRA